MQLGKNSLNDAHLDEHSLPSSALNKLPITFHNYDSQFLRGHKDDVFCMRPTRERQMKTLGNNN